MLINVKPVTPIVKEKFSLFPHNFKNAGDLSFQIGKNLWGRAVQFNPEDVRSLNTSGPLDALHGLKRIPAAGGGL